MNSFSWHFVKFTRRLSCFVYISLHSNVTLPLLSLGLRVVTGIRELGCELCHLWHPETLRWIFSLYVPTKNYYTFLYIFNKRKTKRRSEQERNVRIYLVSVHHDVKKKKTTPSPTMIINIIETTLDSLIFHSNIFCYSLINKIVSILKRKWKRKISLRKGRND